MKRAQPAFALVLLAAVATTWGAGAALERHATATEEGRLLYLPNGRYLRVASLGQAPVLADLIYLWAIQFYSDYERADRFRYVEHVFGDVIAELDPHYIDAYWLGAMILIVEAGDLNAGLALLDQGIERNPDQWVLPYLAAWECYLGGERERAIPYFEAAASVPGAPMVARRMHASMLARVAGNARLALRLWIEVLEDPAADEVSIAIAKRKIRALQMQVDLENLGAAVRGFRSDNGRLPYSLEELRRRGYIAEVPSDSEGRRYVYDPRTGTVSAPAGRVLGAS